MPEPTLESLLLQRATSIGPDPMAGPISDYPGAKIGMMSMPGTPGKLSGMLKGATRDPLPPEWRIPKPDPTVGETSSGALEQILRWAGLHSDPSDKIAFDEMVRLAEAKAAGKIVDWGKAANSKWRDYTGHNLVPSPHGIINKLLGTNYGNE